MTGKQKVLLDKLYDVLSDLALEAGQDEDFNMVLADMDIFKKSLTDIL